MTASQSLVPYQHPTPTAVTTRSTPHTLIPSNFFTQQTGTAIATELLYRLLFDILQRFLASFQRLASKGLDGCSSWIERKLQERRESKSSSEGSLQIVDEVGKLAAQSGFITCPLTARGGQAGPRPPRWVRGVLEGIEEGSVTERDIWIHTHTG